MQCFSGSFPDAYWMCKKEERPSFHGGERREGDYWRMFKTVLYPVRLIGFLERTGDLGGTWA